MFCAEDWKRFDAPPGCIQGARLIPIRRRDKSVRICAVVDEANYPELSRFKWQIRSDRYVYRHLSHVTEGRGTVTMHRQVLGISKGDPREVDHRNRIRVDNRRSNLRVVDGRCEQLQNVPARGGLRGASLYKPTGRWRARVQQGKRTHYLGYFGSEQEAADAAAAWRREHMPFSNN